jgi:hypothetical protein
MSEKIIFKSGPDLAAGGQRCESRTRIPTYGIPDQGRIPFQFRKIRPMAADGFRRGDIAHGRRRSG